MSATGTAVVLSAVPNSVPFKRGHDPRRQVGPKLSPAELKFREAIEQEHIPLASAALTELYQAGIEQLQKGTAGGVIAGTKAIEAFMKICGLIKKPTDNAAIQEAAMAMLGEMIAVARARRADPGSAG